MSDVSSAIGSIGGGLIKGIADDVLGISDTINSAYNIEASKQADITNYIRFLENRNYETNLANTAYQRARKDMEAAGINPALLATASAASSPSSTPSYYNPAPSTANGVAGIIGSAVSLGEKRFKPVRIIGKVNPSINAYSLSLSNI